MKNCEQTKGMSVWEHGISVMNYLTDIVLHLKYNNKLKYCWKIPNWIYENKQLILDNLLPLHILQIYALYHDCGKPYCKIIDKEGKVHFPEHAKVSYDIWLKNNTNKQIASLILKDMNIHLLKSKDVKLFSENKEAVSLIISGLSEIHSNAEMFGGIDSVSFKIKWKQINKRGKQILKHIGEKHENQKID